jgi:hypothetical protein
MMGLRDLYSYQPPTDAHAVMVFLLRAGYRPYTCSPGSSVVWARTLYQDVPDLNYPAWGEEEKGGYVWRGEEYTAREPDFYETALLIKELAFCDTVQQISLDSKPEMLLDKASIIVEIGGEYVLRPWNAPKTPRARKT